MSFVPNLFQQRAFRFLLSLSAFLLCPSVHAGASKAPTPHVDENGITILGNGYLYPGDSYIENRKGFTSCYRWMGKNELKKWTEKSGPILYDMSPREASHLNRYKAKNKTAYCWLNPMGSLKGGRNEFYGKHLVKINFIEDRVLYNRNTRTYSTPNEAEDTIHESYKLNVDTELVYANYRNNNKHLWFQEIMIKSAEAVASFETINPAIFEILEEELSKILSSFNLLFRTYHFFFNHCIGDPNPDHRSWHNCTYREYACLTYRD